MVLPHPVGLPERIFMVGKDGPTMFTAHDYLREVGVLGDVVERDQPISSHEIEEATLAVLGVRLFSQQTFEAYVDERDSAEYAGRRIWNALSRAAQNERGLYSKMQHRRKDRLWARKLQERRLGQDGLERRVDMLTMRECFVQLPLAEGDVQTFLDVNRLTHAHQQGVVAATPKVGAKALRIIDELTGSTR